MCGVDIADTIYGASLPYTTQGQQSLSLPDVNTLTPNVYVEPMELYDSIFWGEQKCMHLLTALSQWADVDLAEAPDPWNSGVDAMNFDFLAQPPPGQPPQQQFYF